MLKMMKKFGVDVDEVREKHLPDDFIRFHFTSSRKRMSTICEKVDKTAHNYDKRIHMKGASEYIVDSCTHYLNAEGQRAELTD